MIEPCASSTALLTMFSDAINSISCCWRPSSLRIASAISGSASARVAEKKFGNSGSDAAALIGVPRGERADRSGEGSALPCAERRFQGWRQPPKVWGWWLAWGSLDGVRVGAQASGKHCSRSPLVAHLSRQSREPADYGRNRTAAEGPAPGTLRRLAS